MNDPTNPSRNGNVTPEPAPRCLACQGALPPGRARRYCSDRCRQAGWRRRNQPATPVPPLPQPGSPRASSIYECPDCESRYLGTQRCDDCNTFCKKLGTGGACPCCDELITIEELTQP